MEVRAVGSCGERQRLLDTFLKAAGEMSALLNEQVRAAAQGDTDFSRFDPLIHMAGHKKKQAKYAWIAHVEAHGCADL